MADAFNEPPTAGNVQHTEQVEPSKRDEPPLTIGKGPTCQHCGAVNLSDTEAPPGIRCDDCGKLVWLDDGQSLSKVRWHDHDLAAMAPDDLPPCLACGDPCDTQTLDDVWRCSRCMTAANQQDD